MATWLIKTEPDCYHWDDMKRDKRTAWTDVTNAAAQKHMRSIKKGDITYFYHTGDEKAIVGICEVVKGAYPDPDHPGLTANGDPKRVLFDIKPLKEPKNLVTLKDVKNSGLLDDFLLVRQSRLSVVPVDPKHDKVLKKMMGM
ncbi:MAG: EVE domain-containing protein [Phycisphaeraceae bacterium]|nr:EVE domain-containing protein [Phycisphaerales bacterium]MCB9859040.1 EVE domain-containing protein [Phycisphaeraceae bacterium]